MLFVPALCSIAAMWVSCLCWWIINRGYWSPWQDDCSKRNLIYGVQKKKKKRTSGPGECINVHRHQGSATFEKQKQLQGQSSQAGSGLRSKIRIELGTITRTLAHNFEETPWRRQWGAFDRRPILYFPDMCTGGCAKCLGGTLIPLALFGFLANILLFFPGGKVIDNNDHLSDEVWFFGGILGSGVLVSGEALKSSQRFCRILLKLGTFWTRRYLVANKSPSIAWCKSVPYFFPSPLGPDTDISTTFTK